MLAIALGGVSPLLHHPRALALLLVSAIAGVALAVLASGARTRSEGHRRRATRELRRCSAIPARHGAAVGRVASDSACSLGPRCLGLGWIGIGLVAVGLTLRILAMAALGSRFSPMVVVQRGHPLHTTGPYALVRHPGYLGSWLANVGSAWRSQAS